MKDLGFDDFMIIDKINTSNTKFDASISALSNLKKQGISSEIISLIMEKSEHNTKTKTGIYFATEEDEQKIIHPSVFSGTNSNSAAQNLVSGFINSKKRAQLPKIKSSNVIASATPEFTFIFDPSTTSVSNLQNSQGGNTTFIQDWWFRTASNPNEFVLIKLTVKDRKNLREVIVGKSSSLSSSDGVDPKYALPFDIEQKEGNTFKVTPQNLEPGEYCFIYQGQVPSGRSNQSVFDFSIE